MSWIVGDGFDYYVGTGDLSKSVWDTVNNQFSNFQSPRFSPGQALFTTNGTTLNKNISGNPNTLYVAFAFYQGGALSGSSAYVAFTFSDGGTAQFAICVESGGNITLKRGSESGTVIATYAAAFAQDVWTHFQCRVVIDPAAGTFTVRKNGSASDSFSATGLNTRVSGNSQATAMYVYGNGGAGNPYRLDDVLVFSGAGAAPNTWVGDCRAICLPAIGDTAQKQFAPFGPSSATFGNGGSNGGFGIAANTMYFDGPYTPSRGGTVSKLSMIGNNTQTGHTKLAIYLNDGAAGAPGTLLAQTAALTNPSTGTIDFTFASGVPVSAAKSYYFAILADAAWTTQLGNAGSYHQSVAQSYATGFPSTAPVLGTGGAFQPWQQATMSGNAFQVSEAIADGDTTYVFDSTVNDMDLYTIDQLPTTGIQSIIGVVSKLYWKKSDAGLRNGQLQVKSGATQVTGPDTIMGSTYTYTYRVDTTDPATAAAWTVAGVNALQIGQKVTS